MYRVAKFTLLLNAVLILRCTAVLALNQKIPLTKCCMDHQVYVAELDLCREWKTQVFSQQSRAPPVHVIGRDAKSFLVENNYFAFNQNLKKCPAGYVGTSSNNFTFYEDGSAFSSTEQIIFQPGEFCLQESFPTGRLVARYCIRDTCHLTETCIRKCCPVHMAFDIPTMSCTNHSGLLNVTLHNQTGYPINLHSDHLFIRDGVAPQCQQGYTAITLNRNRYQLRTRGWLYVFSDRWCSGDKPLLTDEYCVDHFSDSNKTLKQEALVCVEKTPPIHPYFLFISALFLIATFIVYALIPEIRNIHGVVIMCYVVSRAAAYLIFGILQLVGGKSTVICRIMAITVHFSYLSTYTWLNVVCFDIWWTLRSMQPSSSINQASHQHHLGKPFFAYSVYSWGVASIVVAVGQILDHYKTSLPDNIIRPEFGGDNCWFSSYGAMIAYVYGPVCLLILVDVVLFLLTIVLLRRAGIGSNHRHSRERYRLRVIFGLFVLKMVSWIAEFIGYAVGCLVALAYVIDVVETFSSVLTFAIFVCKSNVWHLLKKKWQCLERCERYFPYFKSPLNRNSNRTTVSTYVSSRELLHIDLVKSPSRTPKESTTGRQSTIPLSA